MKRALHISILALFSSITLHSTAQSTQDLYNTGTLYLAGDYLYIPGIFTNTSAASYQNNFSIYLNGDISNSQASMVVGTGTTNLAGSSMQTISGTQVFKTYNLVTNNTAGFTLNNDLSVTNVHTFTNGKITSSATPNYLIYEAGSSYSGDADARHVNGWVKKRGTTNFDFPVGNGTVIRKAGVQNLSVNSEINCKYNAPTTNKTWTAPLSALDGNEYWVIDKVSGGTAQISLNWDNSKVAFPTYTVADIRVAHYNGSTWISEGGTASGTAATTGTILSAAVSSFSPFTFGSISFALPLNFLSFNGKRVKDCNNLVWDVGSEINNDRFEIERSSDGKTFTSIGRVKSKGTGAHTYDYKDCVDFSGTFYYRLKQVDFDNKYTYSTIIAVNSNSVETAVVVVNNPVSDAIHFKTQNIDKGTYTIHLFNALGQLMVNQELGIDAANGEYTIPFNSISPGSYFMELSGHAVSYRQKLIVQ